MKRGTVSAKVLLLLVRVRDLRTRLLQRRSLSDEYRANRQSPAAKGCQKQRKGLLISKAHVTHVLLEQLSARESSAAT